MIRIPHRGSLCKKWATVQAPKLAKTFAWHPMLTLSRSGMQKCCSSKETVQKKESTEAKRAETECTEAKRAEKPNKAYSEGGSDDDSEDEEEELTDMELATAAIMENCTKAGLCTLLCFLLADWLKIDLSLSYQYTEVKDAVLGAQSSVALAAVATGALLIQPDSIVKEKTLLPSRAVMEALEQAENKLDSTIEISIGLGPLLSERFRPGEQAAPEAMTATPLASGLRLFQLWFARPFAPSTLSPFQAALLLPSGALYLAANELLLRGVVAVLISRWARDAILQADSNSLLLWVKVFGFANEDTYRWIGAIAIGLLTAWATSGIAEKAQQWARVVLRKNILDDPEGSKESSGERLSSSSNSSSSTNGSKGEEDRQEGESTSQLPGSHNEGVKDDGGQAREVQGTNSSSSSINNDRDKGIWKKIDVDELGPNQAITYNATTGEVGVIDVLAASERDLPTQEDEVVYNLVSAYGLAQVLQVTILYGLTGNLLAPLTARALMDLYGLTIVRSSNKVLNTAA